MFKYDLLKNGYFGLMWIFNISILGDCMIKIIILYLLRPLRTTLSIISISLIERTILFGEYILDFQN